MLDENDSRSKDELIKDIISHAKLLATVDFEKLEAEGVIEKVRGGYLVKKYSLLPEVAIKYLVKSNTPTKTGRKILIFKPPNSFIDLARKK
ncbi:hypothetical protein [Serratia plymuthica]|uniref:hypothetical protein n=1 Tax=Serratia plymuthica TaxID=82996 RepID=UPI00390C6162